MVNLIACTDIEGGLGKNGTIPWHCPLDLRRFKERTRGSVIIIGRKTHESLGRLLPDRTTVICTRDMAKVPHGAFWGQDPVHALTIAKALASVSETGEVWVCGGAEIYRQLYESCDKAYISTYGGKFGCDTFMPDMPECFTHLYAEAYTSEAEGVNGRSLRIDCYINLAK